jgi:DNA-binding MurR/RpiR family transcriptional regulator
VTVDAEPTTASAAARLRGRLLALSEAERSVAEWILLDPAPLVRMSMSQVAQQCGVSDTTVLRMCRTAGFVGFTDLKLALAQDLVRPTQLIHDDIEPDDPPAALLRKVFHANIQALYDTLELTDVDALVRAVDALEAARTITITGVGGSAIVAQALYQRLYRLGRPCDAPQDVHLQLMHAALNGPGDVVFAVTYSGVTKDTVEILQQARARGATTIALTGNAQSPASRHSDIVLTSVSHETRTEPIAARVAQLTLVDALAIIYSVRHLTQTLDSESRFNQAVITKSL